MVFIVLALGGGGGGGENQLATTITHSLVNIITRVGNVETLKNKKPADKMILYNYSTVYALSYIVKSNSGEFFLLG